MKDSILVFGGGILQLSIIKRTKILGFKAIVIDPDANAPGKEIADVFETVAGDDFKSTKRIATENNIKGVITAATDKPILMMSRIAEEMDLPFPSYSSCETFLDKAKFKQFLKFYNLPHAKGEMYEGPIEVRFLNINFPTITKPVTNSGSRGVLKSNNKIELQNAIHETLEHSKDGRFLIEDYLEGDEISVEALFQHGKVHILQITDKIVTPPPYNVELGHIQPSKFNVLSNDIEILLQKVVDESGLNNCALHPELKINDGKITIIEIGPRLGGDFITSDLVPLSTDVNMEEQVIRIATGQEISYSIRNNASIITFFNFPIQKIVKNQLIVEKQKSKYPGLKSMHFNLKIGDITPQITNSLNRYGYYILHGHSIPELLNMKTEIDLSVQNEIY